ncbi:Xylogalacturonan beta-1,3-xylosyltransferase [Vitis vinifera]|uniref:Xylogalacturonan beta-1,3-xylosyltransferase n=1 Tax=Vitis vinifera TaxID=29760 RepID=A0A438CTC6_VITVI|nr:Xylogalacturonan beta-1,3-xylosyltransferase [Vitis vinifera]
MHCCLIISCQDSQLSASPLNCRHKLVFFAGRVQNSHIRQELMAVWGNDTDIDLFSGSPPFPYEEGLRKSKYCLHVKGYEVNTARVCDAIHYGCIPVIVSNYYDLPFSNVWTGASSQMDDVYISTRMQLSLPHSLGCILKYVEESKAESIYKITVVSSRLAQNIPQRENEVSFWTPQYQLEWVAEGNMCKIVVRATMARSNAVG